MQNFTIHIICSLKKLCSSESTENHKFFLIKVHSVCTYRTQYFYLVLLAAKKVEVSLNSYVLRFGWSKTPWHYDVISGAHY